MPGIAFGLGDVQVGGVAEQEKIELGYLTRFFQRAQRRLKTGNHAMGIFVVHRHDDGGTGVDGCVIGSEVSGGFKAERVDAQHLQHKSKRTAPEGKAEPGKADPKQHQNNSFQGVEFVGAEDIKHDVNPADSSQQAQDHIDIAAQRFAWDANGIRRHL